MTLFENSTTNVHDDSSSSPSSSPSIIYSPKPNESEVERLLEKYPLIGTDQYSYGTAGFRYKATELAPVMVRVGIVAAIQAVATVTAADDDNEDDSFCTIGVMITASHNDESYNGVKFAQSPTGGMMDSIGERQATYIVNERNNTTLWEYVTTQRKQQQQQQRNKKMIVVHIGRDTREHSASFTCLVRTVVLAMGCYVYDHGIVTTPMLHHCVKHATPYYIPSIIPTRPGIYGYYDILLNSYRALLLTKSKSMKNSTSSTITTTVDGLMTTLYVDCACGVGYPHLQYISNNLNPSNTIHLPTMVTNTSTKIVPFNPPEAGPLNIGCGSEYIQKELHLPNWYDNETIVSNNKADERNVGQVSSSKWRYCASLDGDADRIVFFYCKPSSVNDNHELRLLDGDKIAALICQFIKQELSTLQQGIEKHQLQQRQRTPSPSIRLGVVQTAYANGASTSYLQSVLGSENVLIAKTGVKYVHAMAHDEFDIGVYFEANGHGTIVFGDNFYRYMYAVEQQLLFENECHSTISTRVYQAFHRLRLLPALVNQAVGDAISDLLLIDAILQIQNITIEEWDTSMYTDLPSRQGKVQVQDRTIIVTNDNETQCIEPTTVQDAINKAVQSCSTSSSNDGDQNNNGGNHCRAFIRPSGTEDVVRVYAEAPTRTQADELANKIIDIVYEMCHGIGPKQSFPTSKM